MNRQSEIRGIGYRFAIGSNIIMSSASRRIHARFGTKRANRYQSTDFCMDSFWMTRARFPGVPYLFLLPIADCRLTIADSRLPPPVSALFSCHCHFACVPCRKITKNSLKGNFAMKTRLLFLLALALLVSCQKKNEKPPMPVQRFAKIYSDVVLVSQGLDSLAAREEVDSILAAEQVSRDQLRQVTAFFDKHPELWDEFFKIVEKNLEDSTSIKVRAEALGDSVQGKLP